MKSQDKHAAVTTLGALRNIERLLKEIVDKPVPKHPFEDRDDYAVALGNAQGCASAALHDLDDLWEYFLNV